LWDAGNEVNDDATLKIKMSGLYLFANFHVVTREELKGASEEYLLDSEESKDLTFASTAEAQKEDEFSNISTHIFSNLHLSDTKWG
jgi:hypothetical protein